jgi:hypothetical protein
MVRVSCPQNDEEIFEVRRREDIRDVSVLWVFYPNCPNSNKIMVFKGNAPTRDAKKVDPHCCQKRGCEQLP